MKARVTVARRIGLALLATSATLMTASCAAGQNAATANETPAIDGTIGLVGSIHLDALAVSAPPVSCYLPGGAAALTLVIVNAGTKSDTLAGVSSPRFTSSILAASADDAAAYTQAEPGTGSCAPVPSGSASPAVVVPPSQPLPAPATPKPIGAGQSLQLGLTNTGTDTSADPVIVLRGLTGGPLYAGSSIPITFTFVNSGAITLTVPVQLSIVPNNSSIPEGTNTPVG
ncbi:MAG: hypothetical protein ABI112_17260 [Terracoccus sp.]